MIEFISLAIIMAIAFFAHFKIMQLKRDHESQYSWDYECRECLYCIQQEFRHECESYARKMVSAYCGNKNRYISYPLYTNVLNQYRDSIQILKNKYTSDINKQATERMGKYRAVTIPEYIIAEYKRNIEDITDTFYKFGNFVQDEMPMNK